MSKTFKEVRYEFGNEPRQRKPKTLREFFTASEAFENQNNDRLLERHQRRFHQRLAAG